MNIISGDALELDLRALLEARPRPRAICGNLPDSITTPLIERIVACADAWDEAVIMVQREYARRMAAAELATSDYSSLTLFVSYHCDAPILRCRRVRLLPGAGDRFIGRPVAAGRARSEWIVHRSIRETMRRCCCG